MHNGLLLSNPYPVYAIIRFSGVSCLQTTESLLYDVVLFGNQVVVSQPCGVIGLTVSMGIVAILVMAAVRLTQLSVSCSVSINRGNWLDKRRQEL